MAGTDTGLKQLQRLRNSFRNQDSPSTGGAGLDDTDPESGKPPIYMAPLDSTLDLNTGEVGGPSAKAAKNAKANRQEEETEVRLEKKYGPTKNWAKGGFVRHGKEIRGKTKGRMR